MAAQFIKQCLGKIAEIKSVFSLVTTS